MKKGTFQKQNMGKYANALRKLPYDTSDSQIIHSLINNLNTIDPNRFETIHTYNFPTYPGATKTFIYGVEEPIDFVSIANFLEEIPNSNIDRYRSTIIVKMGNIIKKQTIFMVPKKNFIDELERIIIGMGIDKKHNIELILDIRSLYMSAFGGNIISSKDNQKSNCILNCWKGRHSFNAYAKKNPIDNIEYISSRLRPSNKLGFTHEIGGNVQLEKEVFLQEQQIGLFIYKILQSQINKIDQSDLLSSEEKIDIIDPYVEFSIAYTGDLTKKDYKIIFDKDIKGNNIGYGIPTLKRDFYQNILHNNYFKVIIFDILPQVGKTKRYE